MRRQESFYVTCCMNNYEELAFETVKLEILLGSEKYKPEDFLIEVAKRDSVSRMMEF